ncbi:hypothetical protein [Tunturiibacter gelidoferens]|uniref:Uncharacterized protein n=3 Tax=Tunturiibacter TaxID=3154218 RepID=A0A7Y9NKI7_9BACT|nr:hypothetical protein [Edaphobacter lichenicola]MBB5339827.1 hypothetical protein [Edaphobacter lichenicola]NYF50852.1 hypothetical protein [Edaphobacter lichenicola]
MKIQTLILALLLSMATSIAQGQALPTAESSMASTLGPNLPDLDGVFHYALSASEVIQYGYYKSGETTYATDLSGNAAYTSRSTARPFSVLFAGGVILGNQTGNGTSTFWNISASQGYVTRHWIFNISDSFSFLPQSPTTGLSGIAGVGDLGALPIQGPSAGPIGDILTTNGDRIGNGLSGSVEREISRNTSISGSGNWGVLHYLDSNAGLDSSQVSGVVALNRRIDARSSVSVSGVYSTYSYSGSGAGLTTPDFQTRGINLSYQRVLSRTLSFSASVGPQWVSSSNSAAIPNSTDIAVSAGISYGNRNVHAGLNYTRGVNNGSGVLPGALSDSFVASASRTYGRDWVVSLSGAYTRSSGLNQFLLGSSIIVSNDTYDTVYGGFQVTRRFSPHFSGYASYTAASQSNNNNLIVPVTQNVLDGTYQTFGFGVTFTPRSTNLGQF